MAEYVSVVADLNESLRFLHGFEKEYPKIRRRVLAGVGQSSANRAKKAYRGMLNKQSGNLYKSIKKGVIKSGKAVIISPKARGSNQVFYGYALAKGSLIEAKKKKYLTFQVEGKWVKKKSVKLSEHDFIEGPVMKYIGSQDYYNQIDKLIKKEILKLERKGYTIPTNSTITGD